VSLSLNAVPDRGKTVIANLVKTYDEISWISDLCAILHDSHVVLHLSDGMYYLVADGANSLRQRCV
jgi:hypothetical protein